MAAEEAVLSGLACLSRLQHLGLGFVPHLNVCWGKLAPSLLQLSDLRSLKLKGINPSRPNKSELVIEALEQLPRLQRLGLHGDWLGQATDALARALGSGTFQLTLLHLAGVTRQLSESAELPALTVALRLQTALASLHIICYRRGTQGLEALSASLLACSATLTELDLSSTTAALRLCDAALLSDMLASLPALRHLNLARIGLHEKNAARLVPALRAIAPSLLSLSLERNGVPMSEAFYALVPALRDMTGLTRLQLRGTCHGLVGLTQLASTVLPNMAHLRDLGLSQTMMGADAFKVIAPALQTLPQLQSLGLADNPIGSKAARLIAALIPSLPTLQQLDCRLTGVKEGDVPSLEAAAATVTGLVVRYLHP